MKFLLIALTIFLSTFARAEETFRVALPFIPKSINPRDNQLNVGQYVALQIYFPLLVQTNEGDWKSEFLDSQTTQANDMSFTRYTLCLKKNLKFSDGSPIGATDLKSSLTRFHSLVEQAPPLKSVSILNPTCVQLDLKEKSPRYFASLQGTASTILKSINENSAVPIGLGPYVISSFGDEEIEMLTQSGQKTARFDKLIFTKVDAASFNPNSYQDINPVALYFKKGDLTRFREIESKSYKTYALILNSENKKFRDCIASEINLNALIESYKLNLEPLPGFLPRGIIGSNVKYKKPSTCQFSKNFAPITMIIPYEEQFKSLTQYKELIFGRMSRFINLRVFEPKKMSEKIFERRPYLSIIAFDTSGTNKAFASEASVYFESFFRDNRILNKPVTGLSEVISSVSTKFKKEDRVRLFEEAHKIILESGFVVPMGESIDKKVFPKELTEIAIADPISGYLQIDKTR